MFVDKVVERLVEEMKKGVVPWQRAWEPGEYRPRNGMSWREYRGLNHFITSLLHPEDPRFFTFEQIRKFPGAHLKKGSKGTPIAFWNLSVKKTGEFDDKGEEITKTSWFCQPWTVFNFSQIEFSENMPRSVERPTFETSTIDRIESFIGKLPVNLNRDSVCQAFYRKSDHSVHVPPVDAFRTSEGMYAVVFHEMIHWTGHKDCLDRKMGERFGNPNYAFEELVAEMGSAFLCAHFGVDNTTFGQSAAYLQNWLQACNDAPNALQKAASMAQKAADHLLVLAGEKTLDKAEEKE